jgi:hypothetical protein
VRHHLVFGRMQVERCSRTVYVANIDKKVDRGDVRAFFEQLCGEFQAGLCQSCAHRHGS